MVPVLLVFHMLGCPYCQSVVGEDSACRDIDKAHVLEIERKHPLISELGITSFPTIVLSLPESIETFSQPRSRKNILEWVDSLC